MTPFRITSPANPMVKMLKSLHAKKGRAESGLFLAEGARLASEAAELNVWPQVLALSSAALERPQVKKLAQEAAAAGARVLEMNENLLGQIAKRDNPQTVIGAYRQRLTPLDALRLPEDALVVALDGVRDPGNFGTIVRTADSVGAHAVILVGQTCDPFSVEAVRATMGSIFAMPLARADFESFNVWRKARGLSLAGASLKGAAPHEAAPADTPLCIFMGNEQSGLSPEMEAACDALVRIPMKGRADSLNLAIATGVMLYDVWRRRGYAGARD
jgi:RNA methyltransferase, TrmH family